MQHTEGKFEIKVKDMKTTLTVVDCQSSNDGYYQCRAKNELGVDTTRASLTVSSEFIIFFKSKWCHWLEADHSVRPIAEPGAVVPKAEKKETRKELPEMAEKMAERQKKKEEKKQKIEGVKEKAKK